MFILDLFEAQQLKTVVILPGGFHPFHPGHLSLYQSAQRAFPGADIFYAATNDKSERPFDIADKKALATIAGVPEGHFVQVKSPFQATEITGQYDPNTTIVVFARSEKDKEKPPFAGGVKKDGSPSYLQPWTGKGGPATQHAYMAYLPTKQFKAGASGVTSATEIRSMWPTADAAQKAQIVQDLYPKNPKVAMQILDKYLGAAVAEGPKDSAPKMGSQERKMAQSAVKGGRDMSAMLGLVRGKDGIATLPKDKKKGVAEAGEWTKLPNGNWRNMHTGTQQSTPPKQKKTRMPKGGFSDESHPIRDDGNEGRPGKQRYPGMKESWDSDTLRLKQEIEYALDDGDDYTAKQYAKMASTPEAKKYLLNIIKQAMYLSDLGGETDWKSMKEAIPSFTPGSEMHKQHQARMAEYGKELNALGKKIKFHQQGQAAVQYKGAMNKMHAEKIRELLAQVDELQQRYGLNEESTAQDPNVIQMKKRARVAHPFAASDEEALALYISDREIKDVDALEREQNRERKMIDRIEQGENKLEQEIAHIDAILAQLTNKQ